MFHTINTFGDHSILSYDTAQFAFRTYIEKIFETTDLEHINLSSDLQSKDIIHDIETKWHKLFYSSIKQDDSFKKIYCSFIHSLYKQLFPNEKVMIYQSFPSIRIQFHNNIVVPAHCDSDSLGNHPIGEKNFMIPITKMYGTNRLFIESKPGQGDFQGIDLDQGQFLFFNGNKCIHYNQKNEEECIRISFDFRCILFDDYLKYIQSGHITHTNPRDPEKSRVATKMVIGGYYQAHFIEESYETMLDWCHQKDLLLQSQPNFGEEEALACYNYMKPGTNFVTEFKQTEELERMICQTTGAKYCVMTTSGNMALILALMALNLPKGSEVIVPNYTMIASINSIKFLDLIPVLTDVDTETFTLSLDHIKQKITKNTSAVMHVSLNNRHTNILEIQDYCKENNLVLIEDAAQSLGCITQGRHFGTFGEIGCFSLSTPKIISTGQGGFCITNNEQLANRMTKIKNFGRAMGGIDIFETFGINMKYTDIQAVIGIEQMKKLPSRVKRMREIYDMYYNHLHSICRMISPKEDTWIPWFIDCFVNKRDELMAWLKLHNIQTRTTYPEIHKTPMYTQDLDVPVSTYVSKHGLFLPSHTLITNSQIRHICKLIHIFHLSNNLTI